MAGRIISIFTAQENIRLNYVLDFVFQQKGMAYTIYSTKDEWNKLENKDINYSYQDIEATVQIQPQGLLFESSYYSGKKISFVKGEIFIDGVSDLFAVIFFYLSRYEEYYPTNRDQHGRIKSEENSFVKHKIHRKPYLDQRVVALWMELSLFYPDLSLVLRPTFDIDIAWAYKNRSLKRSLGAAVKNGKIIQRLQVLRGKKKDPYDTFDQIKFIAKKFPATLCFILLGDWGTYDKNIKWTNDAFQQLIHSLSSEITLGIHPSYGSYRKIEQIEKEKARLHKITSRSVEKSRQHFLRMKIPETYQELIAAGIQEDYSMGFADEVGFRAGTSFPFYFFDLTENKVTSLKLFPFVYMDSAFKDYLNLNVKDAIAVMDSLKKHIARVGGEFTFIWHNSSIHNTEEWKGWLELLEETLAINLQDE